MISVIMPAFDVARFIGAALRSLQDQSLPGWEAVVVDDGSRDGTAAVVAALDEPRVRLICQPNQGVSAARTRALAAARGAAVLFLDADDWLAPDALARLAVALAAAPGAVGAHGPHAVMPEAARPGDPAGRLRPAPPAGELLPGLLVRNPFVNGGQLLLRRTAVDRVGGFDPGIRFGEDWDYWVRLALLGPFATVAGEAPVLFARERRGSAYRRMAADPAAFAPAMEAVFGNPTLVARYGGRLAAIRTRAEAENAWIQGRELLRHGARGAGLRRLRASVAAAPGVKRAALLAAAHALPLLPRPLHGPFAAYP